MSRLASPSYMRRPRGTATCSTSPARCATFVQTAAPRSRSTRRLSGPLSPVLESSLCPHSEVRYVISIISVQGICKLLAETKKSLPSSRTNIPLQDSKEESNSIKHMVSVVALKDATLRKYESGCHTRLERRQQQRRNRSRNLQPHSAEAGPRTRTADRR